MSSKKIYPSIGPENVLTRTTTDLVNIVTYFNLFLLHIKKPASEYRFIISLLRKIFDNHTKVFHKLANTADEFTNIFSLYLFLHYYYYYYYYYCYIYL